MHARTHTACWTQAQLSLPVTPVEQAFASTASLANRRRAIDDFVMHKQLGEGSYSTARLRRTRANVQRPWSMARLTRSRRPPSYPVFHAAAPAQVMLATETATGRELAIKILDKRHIIKEKKIKYVNVEKAVLNRTNHPFIIRLFYTFQDQSSLCTHEQPSGRTRPAGPSLTWTGGSSGGLRGSASDFALDLAPNGDLLDWIRKVCRAASSGTTRLLASRKSAGLTDVSTVSLRYRDGRGRYDRRGRLT